MKPAADVRSIQALRNFQTALKRYLESVRNVLESLQVQANKAEDWIEHDRTRYWPREAKRAEDELVAARNSLLRAKMAATEGQRKSCIDEIKAVERSQARLRHCESQVKVVRHWRQQIRHYGEEFSGKIARLSHFADQDLPRAIATLGRMIDALEKYATPAQPPASPDDPPASPPPHPSR